MSKRTRRAKATPQPKVRGKPVISRDVEFKKIVKLLSDETITKLYTAAIHEDVILEKAMIQIYDFSDTEWTFIKYKLIRLQLIDVLETIKDYAQVKITNSFKNLARAESSNIQSHLFRERFCQYYYQLSVILYVKRSSEVIKHLGRIEFHNICRAVRYFRQDKHIQEASEIISRVSYLQVYFPMEGNSKRGGVQETAFDVTATPSNLAEASFPVANIQEGTTFLGYVAGIFEDEGIGLPYSKLVEKPLTDEELRQKEAHTAKLIRIAQEKRLGRGKSL